MISEAGIVTELQAAPGAVLGQAQFLTRPLTELIDRCRRRPPRVVLTCARGSSAHAATFGKHLIERHLGIPVSTAAPNIATVYRQVLHLKDQLVLTISQSGQSEDLIEFTEMANNAGAITAAFVNDTNSPLASVSGVVLPISAGPELSVAATKSFIATLSALLRFVATWTANDALSKSVERLPYRLLAATRLDWSPAAKVLSLANNLVTIGRGPTLAIAREAALKLKEICDLQAEPFSSAEFLHGPIALVTPNYPILVFMPNDEAAAGLRQLVTHLDRKGATILVTEHEMLREGQLPVLDPDHPDADAICLIQSFYALAIDLAGRRGVDRERPRHLNKVTRTR